MSGDMNRSIIIPGMPKSGTTFLYHVLQENGLISGYSSPTFTKETGFFLNHQSPTRESFNSIFDQADHEKWKLDATPSYIYDPNIVDRISEINGKTDQLVFIICLRQRVEQIFSWYIHFISHHLIFGSWASHGFSNSQPFELSVLNSEL